MATHYDILKVGRGASDEEIKMSFRRLAKKYHPDSNPSRARWAHDKMLRILAAYSVLRNSDKRVAYNRTLPKEIENELRKAYWERLRKREGDIAAKARMLLFDLVRGERAMALRLYDELVSGNGGFDLIDYLGVPDYLDCKFLLAEAYQLAGNIDEALRLYREVYFEDKRCSYYNHFSGEIKDRITKICCHDIPRVRVPRVALECFNRMVDIKFPKMDRAHFYKKVAEAYASLDDLACARLNLDRALSIYPRLGGIKKLLRKLNGN